MKAAADWPRRVAPVRVSVRCGDQMHTISWKRGGLVLHDHAASEESVLAALGGDPPACLDVRRSWIDGHIGTEVAPTAAALVTPLNNLASFLRGAPAPPARRVVLPEPLRRLREISMLFTWGRGLKYGSEEADALAQRSFVERAVIRKVREAALPPAQRILGSSPVQRRPEVAVDLGDTARVDGEVGHRGLRLAITVPASWLTRVWLRGLDVMPDGGFGVETHGSPPDAMSIARWEAGPERSWTLRVATEPMRVNTNHEIT